MQRKESCLNDLKQNFLTNTCIAFYDKGSSFSDTLIRKTLFFSNIPIALSPKLTKSCIIISGFLLKGLFYTGETGVFEIDDESQAEIYVICTKKLFKKKSKHSLFIYTLNTFIEKEKITEFYLRFFKIRPYLLSESISKIFKHHKNIFFHFKKRYFQSEFIVNFIHFVHSRVVCNYKIKNSIQVLQFFYHLFKYLKTFTSKDLFSYFKNNSHYFLAFHQDEYNEIFEPGFIICKDFN